MKMHLTVSAEVEFDDPKAVQLFAIDPDRYLDYAIRQATERMSGWFGYAVSGKVAGTVTTGGYSASHTLHLPPEGNLETESPKCQRPSSGVNPP